MKLTSLSPLIKNSEGFPETEYTTAFAISLVETFKKLATSSIVLTFGVYTSSKANSSSSFL